MFGRKILKYRMKIGSWLRKEVCKSKELLPRGTGFIFEIMKFPLCDQNVSLQSLDVEVLNVR